MFLFFFCSLFFFLEKLKNPHQTVWYVSFSERGTWLKSPCRQYKASTLVHIHEGAAITDTFSYGNKSPLVCEETTGTLQTFGTLSWSESSLCVLLVVWGSSHGLAWCLQSWALISGWVGRTERRLRVTEGARLKVRLVRFSYRKRRRRRCKRTSIRCGEVSSLASTSSRAGFKMEMMASHLSQLWICCDDGCVWNSFWRLIR